MVMGSAAWKPAPFSLMYVYQPSARRRYRHLSANHIGKEVSLQPTKEHPSVQSANIVAQFVGASLLFGANFPFM